MKPSYLTSTLAGCALVFAFAPYSYWFFLPLSLAVFYRSQRFSNSVRCAFCFAMGFYGIGVNWVYHSIQTYGGLPQFPSAVLTLLFIAFLSAAFAGIFLLARLKIFSGLKYHLPWLHFALCWSSFEWIKTTPLLGFPWLELGHALSAGPFKSLLPVSGILGSGFIVVALSAFLCDALLEARIKQFRNTFVVLLLSFFTLGRIHWTTAHNTPLQVTAIQGNFTEFEKWDPDNFGHILGSYIQSTNYHLDSNLIIWPEGALPIPWQQGETLLKPLSTILGLEQVDLILGTPMQANESRFYNSMVTLSDRTQIYHKQNLVYFGENLPLDSLVRPIMHFFAIPEPIYMAPPRQRDPIKTRHGYFAPAICYDIAYHQTLRDFFPAANFIVSLSDDAWFGHSKATPQHVQIAQTQAIVYGRPVIMVNNNGLTSTINSKGIVEQQLADGIQSTLTTKLQGYSGSTPAIYIDDKIFIFLAWVLAILLSSIKKTKFSNIDYNITSNALLKR